MLLVIALALFVSMMVLQWLGYRRGRAGLASSNAGEGLGVVEGAVFALLGLMLAFLFGGAASRLSDRRDAAIREANAIGTAYLRLELLPDADSEQLRALFRSYLASRLRTTELKLNLTAAKQEDETAQKIQQAIWTSAVDSVRGPTNREAALLVLPALNEMFDIATERNTIGQTHAAIPLQGFLILLALIGAVLAGYSMSKVPRPPTLHMLLFALVIALTIYCIFDMEYPRRGFIRIGVADQPLYDLLDSMSTNEKAQG